MKKIAITLIAAASTLLAVGQIDGALLNELEGLAQMQEKGGTGMSPESAYYEATGSMGVESQMDEASQQVQTQESTEPDHHDPQVPPVG